MLSSLFCYAEPVGVLASRGYHITCTKTDLILPCNGFDVEYNDTPFARVILSHALQSIEKGMAPCIVEPGALAAAVPLLVEELGLVGLEADNAAVELFCSDELAKSEGGPHEDLFLVEAPPSRIDDHVSYDDEGRFSFSDLDVQEPFYKVFETSELEKVVSRKSLLGYLERNGLFYWDDGYYIFASNTKSSKYGCPPNLKHLGLEMVRKEPRVKKSTDRLAANTGWERAFKEFELRPDAEVMELLTKSSLIRRSFIDMRKEIGPIDGKVLSSFRDKFQSLGRSVSYAEFSAALKEKNDELEFRFMLFMELRGLLKWTLGACYYE